MNDGQYKGIVERLDAILDKISAVPQLDPSPIVAFTPAVATAHAPSDAGAHRALKNILDVLEDWIDAAKINHETLDHRNEDIGDSCWNQFHPNDIRIMVNEVAREMDVDEPWNEGSTPWV